MRTENSLLQDIIALIAGAIAVFAYLPHNFYLVTIISCAGLYYSLQHASAARCFFRGWLFGLGLFGIGVHWIYYSVATYGELSAFSAALLTLGFVALLALFPAITALTYRLFYTSNNTINDLAIYPASWVIGEWLRSTAFSGFPWLLLGFSQTNASLGAYASVFSVYGVTAILAIMGALCYRFLVAKSPQHYFLLALIGVIWLGGYMLRDVQWTTPFGEPMKVSLIQGNVEQNLKWSAEYYHKNLEIYKSLTEKNWASDIIIWPENAITLPLDSLPGYVEDLDKRAKANNTSLIIAGPIHARENKFYNAALAIGLGKGRYYKRNIVPFGEYTPLEKWLRKFQRFITIPQASTASGPLEQQNLVVNGIFIAPTICYEVAFANTVRSDLPEANVLATITNDVWFGDSDAPWQHLQIAQMRAIQSGRYMLLVSNNGITAIIEPSGHITKTAPQFKQTVLQGSIQGMTGATPWIKYGYYPVLWLSFFILIICKLMQFLLFDPLRQRLRGT